jgi:hypothetical protein
MKLRSVPSLITSTGAAGAAPGMFRSDIGLVSLVSAAGMARPVV